MNILLIQPKWQGLHYRRKIKVNEQEIHPLSLGVVAALSGANKVRIIDEAIEEIPANITDYDLIGLTVNTYTAPRAYYLAAEFRRQGKPVVFGGVHTSLMPEECLQHATAIVIGDAEDTWPVLLQDFESGRLKSKYISTCQAVGKDIPVPRRDLFKNANRKAAYCQVSRGCANQCKFCYLQYISGRSLRIRDIGEVYQELAALPESIILFVDDNLFCERDYALAFFKAITPLEKKWWIQAPTNIYNDEELITVLAESGCFSLSIGFQTANNFNNQQELILQNNVADYKKLVSLLHNYNILVDGTFIFGFDGDTKDTFKETENLIRYLELDTYTFYYLTPYPGTKYYDYFSRENRILTNNLAVFDWDHVVVDPKNMTAAELAQGVHDLYERLDKTYFLGNSLKNIRKYKQVYKSKELLPFLLSIGWNYRNSNIHQAG